MKRLRVHVWGAVQGVGFRPFVYGLATEMGIAGLVENSAQGAVIEAEGDAESLDSLLERIKEELPFPGNVAGMETAELAPTGRSGFRIVSSIAAGAKTAVVLPDIATCPKCLAEMRNPGDRRYRYPFINCTHCGPRYSIITGLPYDRPFTTMAAFPMCSDCQREYEDPSNRRFHAQPIACPVCGPHLELWSPAGDVLAHDDGAIAETARRIRSGQVLAVKGIGGFHLMALAANDDAVRTLRHRKHREAKPLALMATSLAEARQIACLSDEDERLLSGAERPIVLARARPRNGIAKAVAPDQNTVGLMLPYSPLHELLVSAVGSAVVATSGNLSDEPICTDERDALRRFEGIADALLVHNRPIACPVDDSVARVIDGRPMVFRRARGYAPLPLPVSADPGPTLAVGAHLKNAVAVAIPRAFVVGPHIGDLDHAANRDRLEAEVERLQTLFEIAPEGVVCDLHPDYASTQFAESLGLPIRGVQHHVAHALACLTENEVEGPALAVVWDGTGYGLDGTVWGGEFFVIDAAPARRVAHLRPFLLPGGEAAVREGWRCAYGVLFEAMGEAGLAKVGQALGRVHDGVASMLRSEHRCVSTTSAGRLFDAAAALAAGVAYSRFEGEAAMRLEALADGRHLEGYPVRTEPGILDWGPTIEAMLADSSSRAVKAARFHAALAEGIAAIAVRVGLPRVALSGGCFQNKLLAELTNQKLRAQGFMPVVHQRVPPNDGGIAYGQLCAAARTLTLEEDAPCA